MRVVRHVVAQRSVTVTIWLEVDEEVFIWIPHAPLWDFFTPFRFGKTFTVATLNEK